MPFHAALSFCLPNTWISAILISDTKKRERTAPPTVRSFSHTTVCAMSRFIVLLIRHLYGCPNDNTMIRKNSLICKLIRIKTSSKVLFDSYMDSFRPELETCPCCGAKGNCHIHAYRQACSKPDTNHPLPYPYDDARFYRPYRLGTETERRQPPRRPRWLPRRFTSAAWLLFRLHGQALASRQSVTAHWQKRPFW